MRRGLATAACLAALAGAAPACRLADEPPPAAELLGRARALAAALCACADRACAAPVRARWDALTRALSGVTFTAEQVEGLATEDQRFVACLARFEGAR